MGHEYHINDLPNEKISSSIYMKKEPSTCEGSSYSKYLFWPFERIQKNLKRDDPKKSPRKFRSKPREQEEYKGNQRRQSIFTNKFSESSLDDQKEHSRRKEKPLHVRKKTRGILINLCCLLPCNCFRVISYNEKLQLWLLSVFVFLIISSLLAIMFIHQSHSDHQKLPYNSSFFKKFSQHSYSSSDSSAAETETYSNTISIEDQQINNEHQITNPTRKIKRQDKLLSEDHQQQQRKQQQREQQQTEQQQQQREQQQREQQQREQQQREQLSNSWYDLLYYRVTDKVINYIYSVTSSHPFRSSSQKTTKNTPNTILSTKSFGSNEPKEPLYGYPGENLPCTTDSDFLVGLLPQLSGQTALAKVLFYQYVSAFNLGRYKNEFLETYKDNNDNNNTSRMDGNDPKADPSPLFQNNLREYQSGAGIVKQVGEIMKEIHYTCDSYNETEGIKKLKSLLSYAFYSFEGNTCWERILAYCSVFDWNCPLLVELISENDLKHKGYPPFQIEDAKTPGYWIVNHNRNSLTFDEERISFYLQILQRYGIVHNSMEEFEYLRRIVTKIESFLVSISRRSEVGGSAYPRRFESTGTPETPKKLGTEFSIDNISFVDLIFWYKKALFDELSGKNVNEDDYSEVEFPSDERIFTETDDFYLANVGDIFTSFSDYELRCYFSCVIVSKFFDYSAADSNKESEAKTPNHFEEILVGNPIKQQCSYSAYQLGQMLLDEIECNYVNKDSHTLYKLRGLLQQLLKEHLPNSRWKIKSCLDLKNKKISIVTTGSSADLKNIQSADYDKLWRNSAISLLSFVELHPKQVSHIIQEFGVFGINLKTLQIHKQRKWILSDFYPPRLHVISSFTNQYYNNSDHDHYKDDNSSNLLIIPPGWKSLSVYEISYSKDQSVFYSTLLFPCLYKIIKSEIATDPNFLKSGLIESFVNNPEHLREVLQMASKNTYFYNIDNHQSLPSTPYDSGDYFPIDTLVAVLALEMSLGIFKTSGEYILQGEDSLKQYFYTLSQSIFLETLNDYVKSPSSQVYKTFDKSSDSNKEENSFDLKPVYFDKLLNWFFGLSLFDKELELLRVFPKSSSLFSTLKRAYSFNREYQDITKTFCKNTGH